jgi:hypothetical protein
MNRTFASVLVLIVSVAVSIAARCEVMDKEPTIANFWATAVLGGGVGALLWRVRRWAGIVSLIRSFPRFCSRRSTASSTILPSAQTYFEKLVLNTSATSGWHSEPSSCSKHWAQSGGDTRDADVRRPPSTKQ